MSRLIALFLVLFAAPVAPQQPPDATIEERVDAVFERYDSTRSPGCALAVMREGEIVYKRAYGMSDLERDVPLRTDSVFHVASVSKEFTAAAIALLAGEGRLSLDDAVQKHVPDVPDFSREITLRHLVHHTSGLRDQWELLGLAGWRYSRDLITDDDVMSLVRRQRDLNFGPGERYMYSNTGYTLLGLVVKSVTGKSLREFTTERIFEPLGMSRTHFRDDFAEIVPGHALGYRRDRETDSFRLSVTNFDTVGATSLLTTVEDMARWDANFYQGTVGGQPFLNQIHQRGRFNSGREQDYAFGLVHGIYRGLKTVGHGGSDAGYRSAFLRFPEHDLSVVTLCNLAQTNPGGLSREVAELFLEEHLAPLPQRADSARPSEMDDATIARFTGIYWSGERAQPVTIRGHEGRLQARLGRSSFSDVLSARDGALLFLVANREGRFEPAGGPARRLVLWPAGEEQQTEHLERLAPVPEGGFDPRDYEGFYRSEELDAAYRIAFEKGSLRLHRFKREPSEVTAVALDLFQAETGILRFQRGETGQILGFQLDSGRVRNLRFDKQP